MVVKTIGDAVMLVGPDPRHLLQTTLCLIEQVGELDAFPPIRAGVAHGEAHERVGDWYGDIVNLASGITKVAPPGVVLATHAVRQEAPRQISLDAVRGFRAPRRAAPAAALPGHARLENARGSHRAVRAVAPLAPWTLATGGLARLEARVEPEDIVSQRVLGPAGFMRTVTSAPVSPFPRAEQTRSSIRCFLRSSA